MVGDNFKWLLGYWLIINFVTFCLFGLDKRLAMKEKRRISERTLLTFSFIGGVVGGMFAMRLFHHKTRKSLFAIGLPIMFLMQISILIYFAFAH